MTQNVLEHEHLLLRCQVKNTSKVRDLHFIRNWMTSLIESIGMTVLIPPLAKYCDLPNNKGVTALAGLTTSHLAIHFWDENPDLDATIQFDCYSCQTFSIQTVLDQLNVFTITSEVECAYIHRNENFVIDEFRLKYE